jgi:hypothetical protein
MEEMLIDILRHRLYGLAAEIRAVEEGHNARVLPDGSVLVKAESRPRQLSGGPAGHRRRRAAVRLQLPLGRVPGVAARAL